MALSEQWQQWAQAEGERQAAMKCFCDPSSGGRGARSRVSSATENELLNLGLPWDGVTEVLIEVVRVRAGILSTARRAVAATPAGRLRAFEQLLEMQHVTARMAADFAQKAAACTEAVARRRAAVDRYLTDLGDQLQAVLDRGNELERRQAEDNEQISPATDAELIQLGRQEAELRQLLLNCTEAQAEYTRREEAAK